MRLLLAVLFLVACSEDDDGPVAASSEPLEPRLTVCADLADTDWAPWEVIDWDTSEMEPGADFSTLPCWDAELGAVDVAHCSADDQNALYTTLAGEAWRDGWSSDMVWLRYRRCIEREAGTIP